MKNRIPGSQVSELEGQVAAARAAAGDLEDALERERRDAADLAPRQRQASVDYVEACAAYEEARDGTPARLLDAAEAIDRLHAARRTMIEARRGAERVGADLPVVTPRKLQQTADGRGALERLRVKSVISL